MNYEKLSEKCLAYRMNILTVTCLNENDDDYINNMK